MAYYGLTFHFISTNPHLSQLLKNSNYLFVACIYNAEPSLADSLFLGGWWYYTLPVFCMHMLHTLISESS